MSDDDLLILEQLFDLVTDMHQLMSLFLDFCKRNPAKRQDYISKYCSALKRMIKPENVGQALNVYNQDHMKEVRREIAAPLCRNLLRFPIQKKMKK